MFEFYNYTDGSFLETFEGHSDDILCLLETKVDN